MPRTPQDTLVHSYLFLRRAVGLIGLALPFVLILGKQAIDGGGLLDSVSGYYYTDLRGVFVGSMCAIGAFLLSYRGYGRLDDLVGNIAAVAAFGVALCPTAPANASGTDRTLGVLHIVFAGVFYLALAFFCLFLFTRSDNVDPTPRKAERNRIYVACGVVMVVSLVLIVVCGLFLDREVGSLHPALWLEALAIVAFGVAWLTKGEAILRDLSPAPTTTAAPA